MTVLEYLQKQNQIIEAPCGGNGTCGKCLVEIKMPDGSVGLHKACQITYKEGMVVKIVDKPQNMTILSYNACPQHRDPDKNNRAEKVIHNGETAKYGLAIDIGTTTIAGVLIELDSEGDFSVICDNTVANSGRIFGSDVISRLRAASEGKNAEITGFLRKDIRDIIAGLLMGSGIRDIAYVSIAANTAMVHFLNGFDVSGLGKYPYKTVDIDLITTDFGALFDGLDFMGGTPVYIIPGTGAFIGGDIIGGIFACGLAVEKENTLFLDLGTNGEMALASSGVILTASTAAGPVFEGVSIEYGMPAAQGAICSFELNNRGEISLKTINNLPPKGICGTGVIEIIHGLLRSGRITREGVLEKPFRVARKNDGSYILFSQNDVRQVQLAKAAIRTGIDLLLKKQKLSYSEIKKVYLAGGLGQAIDAKKAADIGLLPKELEEKTIAMGNTSLMGAIKFITGDIDENIKTVEMIRSKCTYLDLASDPEFQNRYLDNLNF